MDTLQLTHLRVDLPAEGKARYRVIDLDVDIGADAVDYKYVIITRHSQLLVANTFAQRHCKPRIAVWAGD